VSIRVGVNGAKGKMGRASVGAIKSSEDLQLVFAADVGDSLEKLIADEKADVVVDFTKASDGPENASLIIKAGARPVIGTSGFQKSAIPELDKLCREKKLGGLIVPNFSIGAIKMMQFSAEAAKYFDSAEVVEYHHDGKEESPSGTALRTAELISEAFASKTPKAKASERKEIEIIPGGRGAQLNGVRVHSVRLPGYLADQEVIFGGAGETLSISSRPRDRDCFMGGVCLACRRVTELEGMVYGLENLL